MYNYSNREASARSMEGHNNFANSNPGNSYSPYNNRNRNTQSPRTPRVGTFPSMQNSSQNAYGFSNSNANNTEQQQQRMLDECLRRLQEQAYYLRRAIDEEDLSSTLERATYMLAELGAGPNQQQQQAAAAAVMANNPHYMSPVNFGSSKLSPKNYYELQMKAMDEMPSLEEFFLSLNSSGTSEDYHMANTQPTHTSTTVTNTGYFSGLVNVPDTNVENTGVGNEQVPPLIPAPAPKREPLEELYETVQFCPRVLPRLYLQICAGTALLRSRENKRSSIPSPATNPTTKPPKSSISVMKDLMDHVKCVQEPLRGLFLRNYVLQIFKYPMEDETLEDLYKYLIQNFIEMNQLWVRVQHLPSSKGSHIKADKKERRKREKERNELRILVGTNLVRLSQLDGMTTAIYKEHILPPILKQVVDCHDALAQAYLLDCIIQVFPDDYHIETLPIFLEVLPKLKEKVNVRTILQGLMERLSNFYNSNEADVNNAANIETFEQLGQCVQTISANRTVAAQNQTKNIKPNHSEVIHLQTSLFDFSLKHFPDQFFHLDHILNQCSDTLNVFCATAPMDSAAMADLEKLLMIPLQQLSLKVLELNSFGTLLEFLPWSKRKKVAKGLIESIVSDGEGLSNVGEIESLLKMITPLLKDVPNHLKTGNDDVSSPSDVEYEQNLVAKLVHLLYHDDTDIMYQMLNTTKKYFSEAGKGRIENTMSSLVFATFRLVGRVYQLEFKNELDHAAKAKEKMIEETKESTEETIEHVEEDMTKLSVEGAVESSDKANPEAEESKKPHDDANEEEKTQTNSDDANNEVSNADEKEPKAEGTEEIIDVDTDVDASAKTEDDNIELKEDAIIEESKADPVSEKVGSVEQETEVKTNVIDVIAAPSHEQASEPSLFEDEKEVESAPCHPVVYSYDKTTTCRKVFLFLQQVVSPITPVNPELAYQLYLQIAAVASSYALSYIPTDFSVISYEYLVQAFSVYEDEISDSKAQIRAMTAMVGSLLNCRGFSQTEFGALVTKSAQFSAKLLKKPDQCKMVTICSHLFYTGDDDDTNAYRHPQRVLECLQRSLKIADACTMASSSNVHLFLDILDHYVYYFEKGTPLITDRFVSGLIALIKEHLSGSKDQDVLVHYQQILKYIQHKKTSDNGKEKFAQVLC